MPDQISIKEKVYNLILEDILSMEYKPNDILNEKALIEKYGYSKTAIREALLVLCEEQTLRNLPRFGYQVVHLTRDDIWEMLLYRGIMEVGILSYSYDSFTEEQLAQLEAIDKKCSETDKDIWLHWEYNCQFHLTMISFCNNSYVEEMLRKTLKRLRRAYAQLYGDSRFTSSFSVDTSNHKDIIQALRSKDLEALRTALRRDINSFGGQNLSLNPRFDNIRFE